MTSAFKAPSPVDFATPEQVEDETLTTVYVSPKFQLKHPSSAKFWGFLEYFSPLIFTFTFYNASALWSISLGVYSIPLTIVPDEPMAVVMWARYGTDPATLCNSILREFTDPDPFILLKTFDIAYDPCECVGISFVGYGKILGEG